MSGVEFILSTVIGVVPLVLEAYDRYGKIAGAIKTLRHPQRHLDILHAQVITQETLFRNSVSKLLVALTDDAQKAKSLLSDEPDWDCLRIKNLGQRRLVSPEFGTKTGPCRDTHRRNTSRVELLHDTFEIWRKNARHIHEDLRLICSRLEDLREQPAQDKAMKRFGKRVKLALKKDDFKPLVKELRGLTSDFKELTLSIVDTVKEVDGPTKATEGPAYSKDSCWESLAIYQQIQAASTHLYEIFAMQWSCTTHSAHVASMTCESESLKSGPAGDFIKFETCVRGSELASFNSLQLEVQYTTEVAENRVPPDAQEEKDWSVFMATLEKHTEAMTLNGGSSIKPKTETIPLRNMENAFSSPTKITRPASNLLPGLDLVNIDDACHHFQTTTPTDCKQCVAHFRHNGLYRFYLPNDNRVSPTVSSQRSLAEVMAWYSEDRHQRQLPRCSTAALASLLANAVLQYHSTPWLPDKWHSSSVRFFGIEDLMQQKPNSLVFPSPYFEVAFSRSAVTGKAKALTVVDRASTSSALVNRQLRGIVVRNEVLFHFGIVLLELGHGRPWEQLRLSVLGEYTSQTASTQQQQHQQSTTAVTEDQDDHHIAEELTRGRWADILRNNVAPNFPEMVRKCLYCDFNTGESDLRSEKLQRAFFENVICALQSIEKGLQEFQARWDMFRD